ncbi:unnamed protein product [Periconia digitata]|uniref:Uncharacterized protein n=1 Tax=Periconia digitata TaxID=1303443 RepID=A0A9W4UJU7_9PLEO|nr:unnamed protein product [Periconia digitata]
MRFSTIITALILPAGLLAAPLVETRQARPPKPKPCVRMSPPPDANTTKTRFDAFANAFIYTKNITKAFEYIAQDYINHNPAAQNGFDSAWNILSPIWDSQSITPLRTLYNGTSNQGWVNYRTGSFGEVVDRFRWEAGCIAEHWDQGEKFPSTQ